MNFELYLANLWAYGLQVAILTLTAGLLCRLFQLRTPKVVLTCWQALLAVLLLLPVLEPSTPAALTASGAAGFRITFGSLAAARAAAGRWPATRIIIIAVIIAGIAARLIWVLAGLYKLRLYRMRARTLALNDAELDEAQCKPIARAAFLISSDIPAPVTFGFRRPAILLPERWLELDREQRQAIICHELFHVRRHDWLFHVTEELVRAVLWFHPAVCWVLSRIRLAREEFVDHIVVARTGDQKSYVQALVAFAAADSLKNAVAPAFLRQNHLTERVSLIFEEVSMSRLRIVVSLTAMAVIPLLSGAAAVWSFPFQTATTSRAEALERTNSARFFRSAVRLQHRHDSGRPRVCLQLLPHLV
ncbi:MAG: hypothetical protein DMG57_06950 [Acidobacteria bacterium]|nr:MAG: hypothetical protein DMG57_06950 [Acidobacteriota bacterium]